MKDEIEKAIDKLTPLIHILETQGANGAQIIIGNKKTGSHWKITIMQEGSHACKKGHMKIVNQPLPLETNAKSSLTP